MNRKIEILREALRSCYQQLGVSFEKSVDAKCECFLEGKYTQRTGKRNATNIVVNKNSVIFQEFSTDPRENPCLEKEYPTLQEFLKARMEAQIAKSRGATHFFIAEKIRREQGVEIFFKSSAHDFLQKAWEQELSRRAWEQVGKMAEKWKRDIDHYITSSPEIMRLCALYENSD
jgi:hypothetical protein